MNILAQPRPADDRPKRRALFGGIRRPNYATADGYPMEAVLMGGESGDSPRRSAHRQRRGPIRNAGFPRNNNSQGWYQMRNRRVPKFLPLVFVRQ
jgi:hypothetical protein